MNVRGKNYSKVSDSLAALSDGQLLQVIDGGEKIHRGIGGQSVRVDIEGSPVFVKKIALTDLERQDKLKLCTANIFYLPLCCQYGIGSPGFGAWREVLSHVAASDWVLAGECASFPILYHWRVLPTSAREPLSMDEWGSLDQFVKYWDGDEAVAKRVQDINQAAYDVVLFLEYVPQTLYDWLSAKLKGDASEAAKALSFVEENLESVNLFMNTKSFIHFDAHFKNILTDGKFIYLSDFGLAVSLQFDLSESEKVFLTQHQSYDRCAASTSLLHCIVTSYFGYDDWRGSLRDYLEGRRGSLPVAIDDVLKRNAPMGMVMDHFLQSLKSGSKSIAYPQNELEALLAVRQSAP